MKTTDKQLQYAAVFGSFVAAQVQERRNQGRSSPNYIQIRRMVEDAHAVAEMTIEVQEWIPVDEDDIVP